MKFIGVREAKASLSEHIETAKTENVCVMRHGKPVAMLIGLDGYDIEEVALMGDKSFWEMIEHRRQGTSLPLDEAEQEIQRRRAARGK